MFDPFQLSSHDRLNIFRIQAAVCLISKSSKLPLRLTQSIFYCELQKRYLSLRININYLHSSRYFVLPVLLITQNEEPLGFKKSLITLAFDGKGLKSVSNT